MFDIAICTAGLASGVAPYSIVIDATLEIGDARIIGGSPPALSGALALASDWSEITCCRAVRRTRRNRRCRIRHLVDAPLLVGIDS
jgi:hypothetical protein